MQDSLFMRHWAEHHEEFTAGIAALTQRAWEKAKHALSIGPAYRRWSGTHGPALLGGTVASIATTLLIGVGITILMPSTTIPTPPAVAVEAPLTSLPLLA